MWTHSPFPYIPFCNTVPLCCVRLKLILLVYNLVVTLGCTLDLFPRLSNRFPHIDLRFGLRPKSASRSKVPKSSCRITRNKSPSLSLRLSPFRPHAPKSLLVLLALVLLLFLPQILQFLHLVALTLKPVILFNRNQCQLLKLTQNHQLLSLNPLMSLLMKMLLKNNYNLCKPRSMHSKHIVVSLLVNVVANIVLPVLLDLVMEVMVMMNLIILISRRLLLLFLHLLALNNWMPLLLPLFLT